MLFLKVGGVDNIRVAEIFFFSEGRILELKPQMKQSFVSVPDEERALWLLHYEAWQWFVVRAVLPYHCLRNRPLHSQIQCFVDVLLCSLLLVVCRQGNAYSLSTSVSCFRDSRLQLWGLRGCLCLIIFMFFFLRYNISYKFPSRTTFGSDWL